MDIVGGWTPVFHPCNGQRQPRRRGRVMPDLQLSRYRHALIFSLNSISSPAAVVGSSNSRGSVGQSRRLRAINQLAMLHRLGEDTRHQFWPRSTLGHITHELHKDKIEVGLSLASELLCRVLAPDSPRRVQGTARAWECLLRGLASLELYTGLAGPCLLSGPGLFVCWRETLASKLLIA